MFSTHWTDSTEKLDDSSGGASAIDYIMPCDPQVSEMLIPLEQEISSGGYSGSFEGHGFGESSSDDWLSLHAEFEHLAKAVEVGWKILDRRDEEGNALVDRSTLTKAANFLHWCGRSVWSCFGIVIDAPLVRPGPDGSVDLHWRGLSNETLINIPKELDQPITYFGDDINGNSASGKLGLEDNRGLILWLTKKM